MGHIWIFMAISGRLLAQAGDRLPFLEGCGIQSGGTWAKSRGSWVMSGDSWLFLEGCGPSLEDHGSFWKAVGSSQQGQGPCPKGLGSCLEIHGHFWRAMGPV